VEALDDLCTTRARGRQLCETLSFMILRVNQRAWGANGSASATAMEDSTAELEAGTVLLLPELAFRVLLEERVHFSPSIAAAKNVSFDPSTGRIGGARVEGGEQDALAAMLQRFSDSAEALAQALLPRYRGRLERARASFRPAEIAGRKTTWRHDDTRLHIDSFPATPVQGRRILRIFTNVNPEGRPRSWRLGEPFEDVARRFAAALRAPLPFSGELLRLVGITKSRRSAYDALMLQLHDAMKADVAYQEQATQTAVDFPAGATWLAFTDQVSHAAMAGQYQLEQTFLLPVEAMERPGQSPLRILERIKKRRLV